MHRAKVVLHPDPGLDASFRAFVGVIVGFGLLLALVGQPSAALVELVFGLAAWPVVRIFRAVRAAVSSQEADDAQVEVDGHDLVLGVGERIRVRGKDLDTGYVVAMGEGEAKLVLVQGKKPLVHATFATRAEAREVLGALGLSPLERPVTFAFFFGMRVTVGIDGVLVEWPLLRRKRFVPHAKITRVTATDEEITLHLASGARYVIATNPGKDPGGRDRHAALFERLSAARETLDAGERGAALELLARQGRSPEAWVKELRVAGEARGDQYRTASLPAEALWRIALDPAEKPDLRVGATLALRAGIDDEGRARLRVAAEASASPKVRVALGAAAEDADDEAVARAIRESS